MPPSGYDATTRHLGGGTSVFGGRDMGGSPMKGPDVARCDVPVPQALTGAMSGATPPTCNRYPGHAGKHKSTRIKRGLGKTIWEWKVTPVTPPEVTYDGFGAPIPRYVVKKGMMVRCACPDGYIGVIHLTGKCPLAGLVR